MTLTLNLPPELESQLAREAARLGLSLSDYVLRLLSAGRENRPIVRSGAGLVEYWRREGLVGTRSEIRDAQAHARSLRKRAEKRHQS